MDFIRYIGPHLESLGIEDPKHSPIINDICNGIIQKAEDGAKKYYKGNLSSYYSTTKRIKASLIHKIIEKEVFHNEAQKVMMDVRISSAVVHKLMYLGYISAAVNIAESVYRRAKKYHIFDIAEGMCSLLSHCYALHIGNEELCNKWYERRLEISRQEEIVKKVKHSYSLLSCAVRHNKKNDENLVALFNDTIEKLKEYKDEAESYIYWHLYYYLKTCLHEGTGSYDDMIYYGLKGYEYFDLLPLDHKSVKVAMLSQVVHGYNLNHNYSAAIDYLSIINEMNSAQTNIDLAKLRLSRSLINLYRKNEAQELLESLSSDHTDVREKQQLYLSYITHIPPPSHHPNDPYAMGIAEKIATLYCDLSTGNTERHTHDYICQYIRRHKIQKTREGIVIKMMSLLRYKGYDERKFSPYFTLRTQLEKIKSKLTEVEILRYEKMVDELYVVC